VVQFNFYHKEAQALENSLVGYFSEEARLPRLRFHKGHKGYLRQLLQLNINIIFNFFLRILLIFNEVSYYKTGNFAKKTEYEYCIDRLRTNGA
jgi:hypothetical protein